MTELHPTINFNTIPIFNLMNGLGLIAAILLFKHNSKNIAETKDKKEDLIILLSLSFLICILFSNILSWFIYPDLLQYPLVSRVKMAGYTFYFGLITFTISVFILLKIYKYDYKTYINQIIPSITLFHAFGRLGCSLGGCCFGKTIGYNIFGLNRFPAREIESIFLIILTILFQLKIKNYRHYIYFISYPILRFTLEFYRGDNRGQMFTNMFSPSQEISIALLFITTCILIFNYFKSGLKNH